LKQNATCVLFTTRYY